MKWRPLTSTRAPELNWLCIGLWEFRFWGFGSDFVGPPQHQFNEFISWAAPVTCGGQFDLPREGPTGFSPLTLPASLQIRIPTKENIFSLCDPVNQTGVLFWGNVFFSGGDFDL